MSYEKEISKKVKEKLRNAKRNDNLVETYHILESASRLLDALEVNITNMQKGIEKTIKTSETKNPLNSILQMFGLRIVKDNLILQNEISSEYLEELMTLNDQIFHDKFDELIEKLSQYEKEKRNREFELDKQNSEKVRLIERLKMEMQQERVNYQSQMEGILLNVQQLLTEVDENKNPNIYNELVDILKDIGIEIIWEIQEDKLSIYYTIQKVSKIRENLTARPYKTQMGEFYLIKPCFTDKDGVRIKGLVYTLIKEEDLPAEE